MKRTTRPRKTDAPDLTKPCDLTAGDIERLTCPTGKTQAFLRDASGNGLRVRVTPKGAKAYVFEQSLKNRTIRRTIGSVETWTIEKARAEAVKLAVLLDAVTDPRELEREQAEAKAAAAAEKTAQAAAATAQDAANALTVGEAWARYILERRPQWGERTYADHLKTTQEGGKERKRLPGVKTKPGPLAPLTALRLVDLDAAAVEAWAKREAPTRPARLRLA